MFLIKNDRRDIDVPHGADVLLHICTSWENAAGSWKFYVNGSLLQSGDDFLIDEVIPTNGIVILGQDQDDYGGGFEQDQSFLGQIYGVDSLGKMPRIFPTLLLFTLHLSLVTADNQCRTEVNIPGVTLKGFVIKKIPVTAPNKCDDKCLSEITCQSFNYNIKENICELNNRTKEARPEHLRANTSWFYVRRLIERVPLGSIPELPALSCQEVKASEGSDIISGKYWLDPNKNGKPFLFYCEMNREDPALNFQLTFDGKSVSDYAQFYMYSDFAPLTAFTVCLWMKPAPHSVGGCVFSYSQPFKQNEILICDHVEGFMFTIYGYSRNINLTRGGGELIHICASWEVTAGSCNFYMNGSLLKSDLDFATGHVIPCSGIFILGQELDEFGWSFEEKSFFGQMYGVNMWERLLTAEEIISIYKNCTLAVGNFLKWSDFILGLHGNVRVTSPVTCQP
ncbi:Neuronal pentraxin-2 [Stylophora pistillata]|uniref:Neuronal pentraxin-2 n=1 Tax=Stylophora pistillata TaxID=50429 RepID=A0A2B4RTJ2_STYPI|nr:Neuronal pentraxin-2 [Stylophora pistillata]